MDSNCAFGGLWRGFIVSLDEANRCCQVYVPMLHRDLMPFKDPNDTKGGVVEDLSNYPTAQICSQIRYVKPEVGDPVFIMFECGNCENPVVISNIATCLEENTDAYIAQITGKQSGSGYSDSGILGSGELGDFVPPENASELVSAYMNAAFEVAAIPELRYVYGGRTIPTLDCSGFVCEALRRAGINIWESTGSLAPALERYGFVNIRQYVTTETGAGLQYGDILLKPNAHVEFAVSSSVMLGARSPSQPIGTKAYSNWHKWTHIMRYGGGTSQ